MNTAIESGIAKLKASCLPHINCSPSPTFPQISMICRQGVSCFSSLTVLAAISPVLRAALQPCFHHLSTSLLLPQCDEAVMLLLVKFVQGGMVVASLGKCSKVMEMLKMLGVQIKDISLQKYKNEYYEGEEVKEVLKTKNKVVELDNEGVSNIHDLDGVSIVHEMPSSMVRKSEQINFIKVKEERDEVTIDQSSAQLIDMLKMEKEKLEKEVKILKVSGPTEENLKVTQERVNSLMLEKIAIQTVSNTWKKRSHQLNLVIKSYRNPAEEISELKEALGKLTKILADMRAEKNQLEEKVSKHAVDVNIVRIRDLSNVWKEAEESKAKLLNTTITSKDRLIKSHWKTISQLRNSNAQHMKTIQEMTKEKKSNEKVNNVEEVSKHAEEFDNVRDLSKARKEAEESKAKLLNITRICRDRLNTIFQLRRTSNVQLKKTIQKMTKKRNSIENAKNVEVAKLTNINSQLVKIGKESREKSEAADKNMVDLHKKINKVKGVIVILQLGREKKDAKIQQLMIAYVEAEEEGRKLKQDLSKIKIFVSEKDTSIQKLRQEGYHLHEKAEAALRELAKIKIHPHQFQAEACLKLPDQGYHPLVFIFTSPLALSNKINLDGKKCKRKLLEKEKLFKESESARKRMKFSSGTNLARLVISEKLLEATVQDTPIPCKYRGSGCLFEDFVTNLVDHESDCMFRSVQCPGKHQDKCNWIGPLNQLVQHVLQQECVLVVKSSMSNNLFTAIVNQQRKPVMLMTVEALKYFCYAMVYKDGDGHWVSHVVSFSPLQTIKSLQVEFKIGTGENESLGEKDSFVFGVSSNEATEQEIKDSGNCLRLKDEQVLKYIEENTVLEFIITFKQLDEGSVQEKNSLMFGQSFVHLVKNRKE